MSDSCPTVPATCSTYRPRTKKKCWADRKTCAGVQHPDKDPNAPFGGAGAAGYIVIDNSKTDAHADCPKDAPAVCNKSDATAVNTLLSVVLAAFLMVAYYGRA
eukprot:5801819-Pyramimonas_sp.AAC.2